VIETQDIKNEVRRIIADRLDVEEAKVTPNARFVDDLGADSLGLVELVLAFEEAFDIDITDDEAERIRKVKDVFRYVDRAMAERSS
jgi:acyl carrier protein